MLQILCTRTMLMTYLRVLMPICEGQQSMSHCGAVMGRIARRCKWEAAQHIGLRAQKMPRAIRLRFHLKVVCTNGVLTLSDCFAIYTCITFISQLL